jgi:hypothetical protein
MKVEYGQMLLNGKRADEVAHDVWFYNETQLQELSMMLIDLGIESDFDTEDGFEELWFLIGIRSEYFEAERSREIDERIAERGGFRHGKDLNQQIFLSNDVVTQAAKVIFGDIAVAGYVRVAACEKKGVSVFENEESYQLNCDAEDVVIEFSNGRRVEFSNSEWGAITLLK